MYTIKGTDVDTNIKDERGLDEVIAFIDNLKADLLKSEQDLNSVERG